MKKVTRFSILMVIFLLIFSFLFPVVGFSAPDVTPPTLNDFSVSATEAKPGETVYFTADVTDEGSGVAYVSVSYKAPEGTTYKSARLTYNSETGKYEGSIAFNEYDASGVWNVSSIAFQDRQGNYYSIRHYEQEITNNHTRYTDLSEYAINVGPSDESSPSTTIEIGSAEHIQNGWYASNVSVSLAAEDDGSGVETTYYKLNDGEWAAYTGPFRVEAEGKTVIHYYSVDKAGNQEETKTEEINIDTTAPVTTVSGGNDGWVNQEVSLSLTASDEGSGVEYTEYRLNGGEWAAYSGPLSIKEDGENIVEFRSIDVSGNTEETKTAAIKIDKTAPVLDVSFDNDVINQRNHKLVPIFASVKVSDVLSGVAGFELVSITSNQANNGKGDGSTESDIQGHEIGTEDTEFQIRAETAKNQTRIYTVTYEATDLAGNNTTVSEDIIVNPNKSKGKK